MPKKKKVVKLQVKDDSECVIDSAISLKELALMSKKNVLGILKSLSCSVKLEKIKTDFSEKEIETSTGNNNQVGDEESQADVSGLLVLSELSGDDSNKENEDPRKKKFRSKSSQACTLNNNILSKEDEEFASKKNKTEKVNPLKEIFDDEGNLRSDYDDSDESVVKSDDFDSTEESDVDSSSSEEERCGRKRKKGSKKKKSTLKKRSPKKKNRNKRFKGKENEVTSDVLQSLEPNKNKTPMKYISSGYVDEPRHDLISSSRNPLGTILEDEVGMISTPTKIIHRIAVRDLGVVTPRGKKETNNKEFHSRVSFSIHSYAAAKKIDLETTKLDMNHFEEIREHGVKDLNILLPTNSAKKLYDIYYNTEIKAKYEKYVDSVGYHKVPDTCAYFHCTTMPLILKENSPHLDDISVVKNDESHEELRSRCEVLSECLSKEKARNAALLMGTSQEASEDSNFVSYKCNLCPVVCQRSDTLKTHIKKNHPEVDCSSQDFKNLIKDKKSQCKYCKKKLSHRSVYRHEINCSKKDEVLAFNSSPLKLDNRSGYCPVCKQVKSKLLEHMKTHEIKKEACDLTENTDGNKAFKQLLDDRVIKEISSQSDVRLVPYSEYTEENLLGLLDQEEFAVFKKFSKQVEEEIRSLEEDAAKEKEEFHDDRILINVMIRHAQRDEIFPNEEDLDKDDIEDDEELNYLEDKDVKIDSTTKLYIKKIRSGFIPWLKKTYPGLKMSHLIDWGEQIEKPKYRGFEAYQEKKPKGIFRLSDSIIRKCVVELYNHVGCAAVSKRSLYFSIVRLLKALKYDAEVNEANFKDPNGKIEFITSMNAVMENLSSFQGKLKGAVAKEKNDKDSLNRDAETMRYNKIQKGISEWAVHPDRLNWHLEVDRVFIKVQENPDYIPSPNFITNSSKYGPLEATLNTPYRAGVAHKIPCEAMMKSTDSYDPYVCGPDDDVIEKKDKDGNSVFLLRDWTRPPLHLRCECQKANTICKCGKGAKPSGHCLQLTWDKTNDINRFMYIPNPIFETYYKHMVCSQRFFEKKFPDGPPHLKEKNENWFQGSFLFMTTNGKPIGNVNMEEFEKICQCHVKPGDLRKINCTELRHDADQEVRDSESIVAGHSESVFLSFYNIRAAQASHVLVSALQKNNDTLTPLTNLKQKGIIGADRERLLHQYKKTNSNLMEKKKQQWKGNVILNQKRPISPVLIEEFRNTCMELTEKWIEWHLTLKKVDWMARTIKLLCGIDEKNQILRDCALKMYRGSGSGATKYSLLIHIKKRLQGKEVKEDDRDCLYQLLHYLHYLVKQKGAEWLAVGDRPMEEYTDELRLLRKNLEEVLTVDSSEVSVKKVFGLLVPSKYKRKELEDLIEKANSMKNWFIRADSNYMVINRKNFNM